MQERLAAQCEAHGIGSVLLLQHEPVYTAGRRSAGFASHAQLSAPVFDVPGSRCWLLYSS